MIFMLIILNRIRSLYKSLPWFPPHTASMYSVWKHSALLGTGKTQCIYSATSSISTMGDKVSAQSAGVRKAVLMGVGTASTALGVVGIAVPLLPTTPFLLLASACFATSSKRFHHALHANALFGQYISDYESGRGISLRAKIVTLSLLWITIGSSAIFVADGVYLRILLSIIAIGVTAHLVIVPTAKKRKGG